MTAWQTWVTVLGSAGVIGAAAQFVRGWWDWRTGKADRKVGSYRDAIEAMGEASRWAALYYAYRSWCVRHHGDEPADYPAPHDDKHGQDAP